MYRARLLRSESPRYRDALMGSEDPLRMGTPGLNRIKESQGEWTRG